VFTAANLFLGLLAALLIGLSKSAVPGAGLLAAPLLAAVVSGRAIAGTMLPMLLLADLFAVHWYGTHVRRDVLRPLVGSVAVGFAAGAAFFVVVGSGGRTLEIVLGAIIIALVALQFVRLVRRSPPVVGTPAITGSTGVVGGFTTFVANAAGPVLNTYFVGLGLPKDDLMGTSAWFYFAVNAAKIPIYLAIGRWAAGGAFFTTESLRYNLVLAPAVVFGALVGRRLLAVIPQRVFTNLVLILAGLAAIKLVAGF